MNKEVGCEGMKKEITIDTESNDYKEAKEIWDNFCEEIKHNNRFLVVQTNAGKRLVKHLDEIDKSMFGELPLVWKYYRARKGDLKTGVNSERLNKEFNSAPREIVGDGRGNAQGISYLYLTTDKKTAISEVRPTLGEYVTVAQVKLKSDKPLCSFSFKLLEEWERHMSKPLIKNDVSRNLMYIINDKMSEKIASSIEYIPLQFIIEYIKHLGFSGFSFDSSLDKGHNYILFSDVEIEVVETYLHKVTDVKCEYITEEIIMGKKFDFIKEVSTHYPGISIVKTSLKEIYNCKGDKGCSTEETKKKGVYALFYQDELKKIGKATDKYGIFHRMSQYYRGDKTGGLTEINEGNRDKIKVLYFNLSEDECWFAERRLQVIAHDYGEAMPWEDTTRN